MKNRKPSALSNWISSGRITSAALIGSGNRAKIWVEQADRDLAQRLDVGQQEAQVHPIAPGAANSGGDDAEVSALRRERLTELQLRNARAAEEAAARTGRYTLTAAVQQKLGSVAGQTVATIEAGLPELATALANRFNLSARDVLHALRTEFRSLRQRAASAFRGAAADLPAFVDDDTAGPSDQRPGEQ
jgi:hypothetical protein